MQVSVSGLDNTKTWTLSQKGTGTTPAVSYIYDGFIFRRANGSTTTYSLVSENDNVNNKILLSEKAVVGIPRSNGTETHQTFYFYQTLSSSAQGFKFVISDGTNYYEWSGSNVVNDCKAVLLKGPGLDTDGNILEGQDHGWKPTLPGLVDNGDGTGTLNGHAWVDLGIKSDGKRLVFATTNIGAESPEDAGLYFWWGDIVGHAVGADGKTTPEFDFNSTSASSYGNNTDYVGTDNILKPEKDAATQLWGGGWRMGTSTDFNALLSYRSSTESTINSVTGYEYKSSTNDDLKIFIPKVGDVEGTVRKNTHLYLYWTSTNENEYKAKRFGGTEINGECWRWNGYPIRPVAVIP